VNRGNDAQPIVWQLNGDAANGSFVPMSDPSPGFSWMGALPRAGLFSAPVISDNGKKLTINDTNNGQNTSGSYTYALRVNLNGTVYTTITRLGRATNTNPIIINK
jgi:hypothetical protein